MENIIRIYDQNMKKLAYLENAYNIGYELTLNELWFAHFTLPADDPKNAYCQPFNYVEIYDGKERIELFRIMPSTLTRNTSGNIAYQCEHVLATLLDDVLFKYHQIGNIGIGTTTVLRYIIDRQLIKRWQLGACEFDRRFEYKWENENLLAALFSVPKPFNEAYRWEFDTTGTVWVIHLRRVPTQFKADITYKKNMLEIQKEVDPTTVVTKLYCLGYGEGDNQLDITSVNSGIPYLQANGEATTWGIKSSILVDRRFESPETLKAYGQALLDGLKNPHKSYNVKAVDLYRRSPEKYEKFMPGDVVRITDKEDGIIEDLPIVRVIKSDITGSPGSVQIEIANKSRDIAGSITELADRARINEVYAQGATNQMLVPFADNADPSHPAVMRIYIPDTMARINKCILNFLLEALRAYSKAVGGGGYSVQSTNSGGGGTQTSNDGGAGQTTSTVAAARQETSHIQRTLPGASVEETRNDGTHIHTIPQGTRLLTEGGGSVTWGAGGLHSHILGNHGHYIDIPSHSHNVNIPNHKHSVNIPNHTHTVTLPEHTHALEFGIYQGTTASAVTVRVDGKVVPAAVAGTDIDIIPYLATDAGGKVLRNTWHTIEIIPNTMTRIVANVFMQIFTNSRGGGDY